MKLLKISKKQFSSNYSFAVVGSGPAGFFTSKHLLKKLENISIDFYEKLPHPFGLVRNGVSPDHQDVKNVTTDFSQILENNKVKFMGNIKIGKDLSLEDLNRNYSAIILSYGADGENTLNLPNEDNFGCFSARNFVNWYNGHISYSNDSKINSIDFSQVKDVVIIGNGNVAIDVARLLAKEEKDLRHLDIPEHVLSKLKDSNIENIHIIARRGLMQSAFTIKEIRELSKIEGINLIIYKDEIENSLNENSIEEIEALVPADKRQLLRKIEFVKKFLTVDRKDHNSLASIPHKRRNVYFRFLQNPSQIHVNNTSGNVEAISFNKTKLIGKTFSQTFENIPNEIETIRTNLVFKSIGYKSVKLFPQLNFDENEKVLRHQNGIVMNNDNELLRNIFTVGWVKIGAKGIIDTTLRDSYDTAASIFKAISNGTIEPKATDYDYILSKLEENKVKPISYEDWKKIDAYEVEEGKRRNKLREKITDINKMFSLINH